MNTQWFLCSSIFLILISNMISGCSVAATPTATVGTTLASSTTTPSPETAEPTTKQTGTIEASPSRTITPEVGLAATAQSNNMKADMQKLADEKLVSSSAGKYFRVQDFTGEWAKLSYFHWWPLNRKPSNFAIRADVAWDSAMPNSNPAKAGCGFVFHENGADNLHITLLNLDGYVRNYRFEKKVFTDLKGNYAGKFKIPADSAKIMLVVDYQWITVFVNGKQVVRFEDNHLKDGGLAFAVSSGSNNNFGTRCSFTNVELWEFD